MSDEIQIIVEEADPVIIIVQETLIHDGGDGLTEVIGEEHTGLTTTSLTLDHAAAAGKLKQFKNGSRLIASEFSYVGAAVTLTTLPETTDVYTSDYKY